MNHRARYSKRFGYNDNYVGPEPKRKTGGFLHDMTRAAARLERADRARQREQERTQRQTLRDRVAVERVRLRMLQEEIARNVEERNNAIANALRELQDILPCTLQVNDSVSFDSLKVEERYTPLSLPPDLLADLPVPDRRGFAVKPLNWLVRLLPGSADRYRRRSEEADRRYREAVDAFDEAKVAREAEIGRLTKEHEEASTAFLAEAHTHNREVETMRGRYSEGDPEAILYYNELVLARSEYPEGFPQEFKTTYDSNRRVLHIYYRLPAMEAVPAVREVKYSKKSGGVVEVPRRASEIEAIYKDVAVAIALRSMHEIFEADQCSYVDEVEFEGVSGLADGATGRLMKVRVSADKKAFANINLALVDNQACFKKLRGKWMPA